MSNVSVSIKLTQAQAGKLYMGYLKRGERIKELKDALRRIEKMAEEAKDFSIVTAARAALESSKKESA